MVSSLIDGTFFPPNFRIDGEAVFENNGAAFEGHSGGGFANKNGGTAMYEANINWLHVLVRLVG